MSPTGAPTPLQPAVPVRYRPRISDMSAEEVTRLREAFAKLQEKDDEHGYQYLAGIHGLPLPMYCAQAHGQPAFLPWHRAYLYSFEQELRKTGLDVMLPWWDWLGEPHIPPQYEQLPDGSANPLFSMPINEVARQQGERGEGEKGEDSEEPRLAQFDHTIREVHRLKTRLPTAPEIEHMMGEYKDFASFTTNLEDYHGMVHVWVGGHMGDIPWAAYDPIFWSHHCMIDRLWRMWQLRHPQASFPENVATESMKPFGMTAQAVLDPTTLGYDYVISATEVQVG